MSKLLCPIDAQIKMRAKGLSFSYAPAQFPELSALRKVRDSNPRYDVMRTPHFECGSFDHSDNFPFAFGNAFASDADERHKSERKDSTIL